MSSVFKKADKLNLSLSYLQMSYLTYWGPVTYICISKLTIIGSDNGLLPSRRQAIIRTNAGILLIDPFGTKFSEILIEIHTFSFSFKKMYLNTSANLAANLSQPQCVNGGVPI